MARGKGTAEECVILCGTAAFYCIAIVVGISLTALGIAKIVVGAINLHECSIERLIPIYLIVSAVVPILFSRSGSKDDGEENILGFCCGLIGFLFNLAWLICGTVWIYPTYALVTSNNFKTCVGNVTSGCTVGKCPRGFLDFSFAMVTIDWVLMGLWIVWCAFLVCKLCRN